MPLDVKDKASFQLHGSHVLHQQNQVDADDPDSDALLHFPLAHTTRLPIGIDATVWAENSENTCGCQSTKVGLILEVGKVVLGFLGMLLLHDPESQVISGP